ncbi:solute carrier family 35 member E3 [Acrasis kona]|uniref:Solute carrier family 35 member E3 n=1 Tax=Acrasis kona TaxID=1008807 RepID=A0AAW2YXI0_9EUKA
MSQLNPDGPARLAGVIFSLSLNIVASCGTIFINKYLFKSHGFTFGTALTVAHFFFTFALCVIAVWTGFFKFKKLDIMRVLPISIAFCGYVVFNNISLLYNSVAFYQVMKILCTPIILLIEYFLFNKSTDNQTKLTLIPTCCGILITVVTDAEGNLLGTAYAVLAVGANAMYTVYGKTKQNELNANPMQILLYQSITSGCMLIPCVFLLDDYKALFEYEFNTSNLLSILLSCFAAFFVNFSFFLLVGRTSPLTVNVVGYFKTCVVFVGGVLFFSTDPSLQNMVGIGLTLLGVLLYSFLPKSTTAKEKQVSTPDVTEAEDKV